MHGEESRIQDGLEFPYMGRKVVDWHHAAHVMHAYYNL